MPPGSSHLLQPLDVGCFSVLKRLYGRQIEQHMRCGINHIDNPDFLTSYLQARTGTYTESNIRSWFRATGLVPYDPIRVLSQFHIQHKTPTPPNSSHSSESLFWTSATPHNFRQLKRQSLLLEQHLQRRTSGPPSPTNHAFHQLMKGCKLAMYNAFLLAEEKYRFTSSQSKSANKPLSTSIVSTTGRRFNCTRRTRSDTDGRYH